MWKEFWVAGGRVRVSEDASSQGGRLSVGIFNREERVGVWLRVDEANFVVVVIELVW